MILWEDILFKKEQFVMAFANKEKEITKEYVLDIATVYLILMIDGNLEDFEVKCGNSFHAQETLKILKQLLK